MGEEIYKHYEFYKSTKSNTHHQNNQIEEQFQSALNNYISDSSAHHPLIIYNLKESELDNSGSNYFSCQLCNWLKSSKKSKYSTIFRFSSYTIQSSELSTLLQSILHQLCYIAEIHESFSFNVSWWIFFKFIFGKVEF